MTLPAGGVEACNCGFDSFWHRVCPERLAQRFGPMLCIAYCVPARKCRAVSIGSGHRDFAWVFAHLLQIGGIIPTFASRRGGVVVVAGVPGISASSNTHVFSAQSMYGIEAMSDFRVRALQRALLPASRDALAVGGDGESGSPAA